MLQKTKKWLAVNEDSGTLRLNNKSGHKSLAYRGSKLWTELLIRFKISKSFWKVPGWT